MNINSIGINAYRQTLDKPQMNEKPVADRQKSTNDVEKVQVPTQNSKIGSKLGVRLKAGEFDDMLSDDERQALDMVFSKFRNIAASYSSSGSAEKSTVGNFLDVKL